MPLNPPPPLLLATIAAAVTIALTTALATTGTFAYQQSSSLFLWSPMDLEDRCYASLSCYQLKVGQACFLGE
jgi:hypothetical protein